jgi:hypothetical protein
MLMEESGARKLTSSVMAGKLHRSGYFAEMLRRQAEEFESRDLDILLENLRWADLKLKTSAIDAKHIIEEALLASSLRKMLAPQANIL